jgi:hypothetical protein
MHQAPSVEQHPFLRAFRGSFTSALRWHQLDALWDVVRRKGGDWYVYAVGEAPPEQPSSEARTKAFVVEIDALLRAEHEEDYCGIVYADDLRDPSFIKIYDPHNLGVSCGYSTHPPLPGWIMSKLPPCDLPASQQPTASRKRWWQRLFHS